MVTPELKHFPLQNLDYLSAMQWRLCNMLLHNFKLCALKRISYAGNSLTFLTWSPTEMRLSLTLAFVLKAQVHSRFFSLLHPQHLSHFTLENRKVGTLNGGRVGAISCVDSSPSLRAQSAATLNWFHLWKEPFTAVNMLSSSKCTYNITWGFSLVTSSGNIKSGHANYSNIIKSMWMNIINDTPI